MKWFSIITEIYRIKLNRTFYILLNFIILLLILPGCNEAKWEKVPCEIISWDTYEGREIEGLGKGEGGTVVTVSYKFKSKPYEKEFNLSGERYFNPGDTSILHNKCRRSRLCQTGPSNRYFSVNFKVTNLSSLP